LGLSGVLPWALVAQAGDVDVTRRARLAAALQKLADVHRRWALLLTCHRVELYGFGPAPAPSGVRRLDGEAAVRHLFRVAAGLESAVVGESEILGQVREVLARSRQQGTDERVGRLLESAIAAGRAARARPLPPRAGLAEQAVTWLSARATLAARPVLVVGTGVMGRSLATAVAAAGGLVTVASRRSAGASLDLVGAARRAHEMTAVTVALRGEWAELAAAADARPAVRLPPLADLSAPPAVPARVRVALGEDFLGIDQLWRPDDVATAWTAAARMAVEDEVGEYMSWLRSRGSVSTLVALKERGEDRRRARVERLLRRLPELDERGRRLVETMSRQLVTDLLHEPISALRSDLDGSNGDAARRLFRL
jgi:glutamyl-tRNA reductase